tara:strand:+ start:152 stop:655 length:504 start_codon:yes stop_codon:yes gene_type:complete
MPYGKSDYKVIRVTPTLDTSEYAVGDVLFTATAIPNAVLGKGGCSKLIDFYVLDEAKTATDVDFIFSENNTAFGTINATADISDADIAALNINGAMLMDESAAKTGQIDNAQITQVLSLGGGNEPNCPMLLQAADDSTTVYVQGIVRGGTPTFAADDITLIFHIEYR